MPPTAFRHWIQKATSLVLASTCIASCVIGPDDGEAESVPDVGGSPAVIEVSRHAERANCPSDPACTKQDILKVWAIINGAKSAYDVLSTPANVANLVWGLLNTPQPSMSEELARIQAVLSTQIAATDWKISATAMAQQQSIINSWLTAANIAGGVLPNDSLTNQGGALAPEWAHKDVNFFRVFTEHGNDGPVLWNYGTGRNYYWKDYLSDRPAIFTDFGANDVYDWRLALPNFAEMVSKRLIMIATQDPKFRSNGRFDGGFRQELEGYRTKLDEHYDYVVQGIRCLYTYVGSESACVDIYSGNNFTGPTQFSLDSTDFYDGGWAFRTADLQRQKLLNQSGVNEIRGMVQTLAYFNGVLPNVVYIGRPPASFTSSGVASRITWNPATGAWRILNHGAQKVYRALNNSENFNNPAWPSYPHWGRHGDVPVPGDYGNGPQLAVWRPSSGSWLFTAGPGTTASTPATQWGGPGDIPVPARWTGPPSSGILVPAVWRPREGNWYIKGRPYPAQWGGSGDIPVPADYDNDGVLDCAVFRPNDDGNNLAAWYVLPGCTNYDAWFKVQWGIFGDIPLPGDYDGDGRTDWAVFRPDGGDGLSYWWIFPASGTGGFVVQWGVPGDIPVPGRYNHLAYTHIAVYRPSTTTWYDHGESRTYVNGSAGDIPMP